MSSLPTTLAAVLSASQATFNFSSCPAAWEVQTDKVVSSFSLDAFKGTYYELAYHDYTQFPTCPSPSCVRTTKEIDMTNNQVIGHWRLACFSKSYPVDLVFNLTSQPGVFAEHNKVGFNVPNMIVDVGPEVPTADGGKQYEWVIEFQCTTKLGHVDFIGINWYAKDQNMSADKLFQIEQIARDRGLGLYMDDGFKVRNMSQINCPP